MHCAGLEEDSAHADDPDVVYVNGIDPAGKYLIAPCPARDVAAEFATAGADADTDVARHRFDQLQDGLQKVVEGVEEDKLDEAGWGVVFSGRPEHATLVSDLRDRLKPLLDLRKSTAGALYTEYLGPAGVRNETGAEWLNRHGVGSGAADPQQMPYYLLIVGGPEQVPFEFQYRVDIQRAVGRVCFDDPTDYRRYAEAVVANEESGATAAKRLVLFGPRNSGDKATSVSLRRLVAPLQGRLGTKYGWTVTSTTEADATHEALGHLINADDPALLLTAGHGLGLPPDDPDQRARQGALVCADWGGVGTPVRTGDVFAAGDVADDADLSGRMAFLLACFGGGTPAIDDYAHRLDPTAPRQLAPAAFVSALPQKLLAHGMLAVMAHVDRAWGYSFGSARYDSTQTFSSALLRLMNGKRVGVAFDDFNVRTGELAVDQAQMLASVVRKEVDSYLPYGSIWTSATDARNYIVFGDPATRLNT